MRKLNFVVMTLVGVMLTGCHCPCQNKAAVQQVKLGSHAAVTPVDRPDKWWQDRQNYIVDRVKQGNVDLIFVGDSITQEWEGAGRDVWQKYYGDRNAVNLGISGDRTEHVLWRLEHGNIAGISPKLAVVMIGTNNSVGNEYPAQQIGEGIIAIVQKLRADLPHTKILILAIFPNGEKPNAAREKNAEASVIASKMADSKMIFYKNINNVFLGKDGTLSKDIMPDFLHPNTKGYELEAAAIESDIVKLMK